MPCILLLILLLSPRIAIVLLWLFTRFLEPAFHSNLLMLILGFLFLPLTTIVYAWEINNHLAMTGINLVWIIIAVIIDLGGLGGGAHRQTRG